MATIIDTPSFSSNEIYMIAQTDRAIAAGAGASFNGIGVENQPHQQLANRTAYLWGRQNTNIANIATIQQKLVPSSVRNTGANSWPSGSLFGIGLTQNLVGTSVQMPATSPTNCWRVYARGSFQAAVGTGASGVTPPFVSNMVLQLVLYPGGTDLMYGLGGALVTGFALNGFTLSAAEFSDSLFTPGQVAEVIMNINITTGNIASVIPLNAIVSLTAFPG